ncbi:MAG: isochorismatase family protein [Alphaproteobacteria bacterium]|nr:isochorismatase family protein [Alphaproteobacteria bacterium]
MSFEPARSALLLIDFQARLMPQIAEAENALANACRLGEAARLLDVPVLATEQNPDGLGPNVPAIRALAGATLAKTFFDATREDAWAGFLPPVAGGNGRRDLVVAGCETHVCVLQTVLGLLDKGHRVRLAADAVGSRTARNREAALHRAERRGAELVTTEMVVFEWLARSDHPRFRDLLKLVK